MEYIKHRITTLRADNLKEWAELLRHMDKASTRLYLQEKGMSVVKVEPEERTIYLYGKGI